MNDKALSHLRAFFLGRAYPIAVAALVLLSHLFGLEIPLVILLLSALCAALLITRSVVPLVAPFLLIFFGISRQHSPSIQTGSGHLGRPLFLVPFVIMVALLLISLVYVLRERGALRFADLRSLPFLIPSGIFVVTLLLNGAFAPGYTASNLLLALIEGVALTLLIYVFILGFRGERSEELIGYFIYISAVVALLIFVETAILYFSGDVLVSGSAVKDNIFYGWGVANTAGQALTATLPVLFLGAMRSSREAVLCLSAAFLALVTVLLTLSRSALLVTVLLTLSRSALLVAGVIVLLSLVIGCFFGNTKRIFRIFLPALFVVGTLLSVAVWEKASTLVADIFEKGFSDNGRYALWGTGIDEFLKYPIFGRGFYGFEELLSEPLYLYIGFFPRMLHNTVLELLAATGVCGFVGYAVYRFYTARFFFKRPSLAKTMLGLAVLTLLLQSLLDNFLFYVQPTFYYSIAIAITVLLDEQRKTVIK